MSRKRPPRQRKTFGIRACAFLGCTNEFEAINKWHIYCSDVCRNQAYYVRLAEKYTPKTYATPLGSSGDQAAETEEALKRAKSADTDTESILHSKYAPKKSMTMDEFEKELFKDFEDKKEDKP